MDDVPPPTEPSKTGQALADTTAPGDVVQLAGAVLAHVRVVARVPSGLRVSWYGVDYLVTGQHVGATADGEAVWLAEAFTPWAIPPAEPKAPTPTRRRRPKGAPGA